MAESIQLAGSGMIALTRDALATLRALLFRDVGANAASYLQEAGYAGGGALFTAFAAWCMTKGYGQPEAIAASEFQSYASEFFGELGWGALSLGTLRGTIGTLDSSDWAEADPDADLAFPGCHLTTGMLADFFGRLADMPLAVMEVECRSMGAPRCRFLLGSAEALGYVYDEVTRGATYEDAAAAIA